MKSTFYPTRNTDAELAMFHLTEDPPGHFSVWGNQSNAPSLNIGQVEPELARRIYWAIERAWQRDEKWRSGLIEPVPRYGAIIKCGACGGELETVRPGKYRCVKCEP